MTSSLDTVDQMLEGEPVGLKGSGLVELYSIDPDPRAGPGAYDSMQDYATDIMSDPTITDPVVNDLATGLAAGNHDSGGPLGEHQTVHHPDGTIHYDEDSGARIDYEDE